MPLKKPKPVVKKIKPKKRRTKSDTLLELEKRLEERREKK